LHRTASAGVETISKVKMDETAYHETLSSTKTHALFVTLTIVFLALFLWRWSIVGWNGWGITFLCISAFFLFYVFNYRTLKIRITTETLQLTFGIIRWKIPISNIKNCYLDEDSILRYGGAGIHFMFIKGKYRSFWNFLEYPRVVVTLKKKKGPVQEIAFTTRHPEQVIETIQSKFS
jgi:Ca2+/Na+ antiporter